VGFFSDERSNELRAIFFESAQELMQALNEEGLQLEKDPSNMETVRSIRRTVHTIKGDSAACGYRELSELAHELEDVLTPETAVRAGKQLADVVLNAADAFDNMLAAYKGNMRPPDAAPVRELIAAVAAGDIAAEERFDPKFEWTEYESLLIAQHAVRGQRVYNVGLLIDPACPMRAAALQLLRNVMQEVGTLVVIRPNENVTEVPAVVEAAIASHHPKEWIEKKCKIPAVVKEIVVILNSGEGLEGVEMPEATATPHVITAPAPVVVPEPIPTQELSPAPVPNVQVTPVPPPPSPTPTAEGPKAAPKGAMHTPTTSETVLRVEAERIDVVLDLVGELIIGKSMMLDSVAEFSRRFSKDPLHNSFQDAMAFQSQVLGKLQRAVMKIRMVPVEQLFRRFPRIVRDVSRISGKQVELVLQGENTDLDKTILDALAEPLTHLVRNSVDHGIEPEAERVKAGKPEKGTVILNAFHQGNQVVIEVSDDGRGIDRDSVVNKAIEKGIVSREEIVRLSDNEALNLIFHPGLSTASRVTELSGRGMGMDVVKAVMDRLKGSIQIHSEKGFGTTFQLKLPLTLAIIKALLFRVRDRLYAVPLGSVHEITRQAEADIHIVDNHEVVKLRDELLTLIRLSTIIDNTEKITPGGKVFIVVVSVGHRKYGLIVDRLVGEQELVIKALDETVLTTDLVAGASVLGDGRVVLILNTTAVIEHLGHNALDRRVTGVDA
jgi:two-component system chemotaxis sensor kinase CheA